MRTIYEIKIVKKGTRLEFEFYGTGFLYHIDVYKRQGEGEYSFYFKTGVWD